jgi:hypothetical protein
MLHELLGLNNRIPEKSTVKKVASNIESFKSRNMTRLLTLDN